MTMLPDITERSAWHEAGHAVIARALGCAVRSVQIGQHAFCRCDGATDENHFLISAAGPLAEEMAGFDPPYGDAGDRVNRRGFHFRDDGESLRRRARALVQANLDTIEFIASNLFEEGRLTGRQLDLCLKIHANKEAQNAR